MDDALTMRVTLRTFLTKLGFKSIIEASSVAAAWEILSQPGTEIGLILSDQHMPEETGLSLLNKVRSDARLKSTPFIMVTSDGEKEAISEAIRAGVDQYLVKPFQVTELAKKIESINT